MSISVPFSSTTDCSVLMLLLAPCYGPRQISFLGHFCKQNKQKNQQQKNKNKKKQKNKKRKGME
jgi:hypothetical protein